MTRVATGPGRGRTWSGRVNSRTARPIAAARLSRDGAVHFVCMDWRHMDSVSAVGSTVYGERLNLCASKFLFNRGKRAASGMD
jgi:hypothetical protein